MTILTNELKAKLPAAHSGGADRGWLIVGSRRRWKAEAGAAVMTAAITGMLPASMNQKNSDARAAGRVCTWSIDILLRALP